MDTDDALDACLARLAAGDVAARDRIIELCGERLRLLAHRMLRRYPTVRRYDDTDDVFQNAAMRLHRALWRPRFRHLLCYQDLWPWIYCQTLLRLSRQKPNCHQRRLALPLPLIPAR